ncbi:hypothetical protein [Phytobacter massiliensis]|uniref:hypothetical protein n=1 Tax=Phytobacter massiliensis TaxID=1485952 RepID=UPI001F44D925|nr:hypothetical protein [Phytobacter massiliensis]
MFVSFEMCGKQVPGIIANSSGMSWAVLSSAAISLGFYSPFFSRIVHKDSCIINKNMEAVTLDL